ncbi:hypothetical protein LguiA_000530 [Lonicera macranthoides]
MKVGSSIKRKISSGGVVLREQRAKLYIIKRSLTFESSMEGAKGSRETMG